MLGAHFSHIPCLSNLRGSHSLRTARASSRFEALQNLSRRVSKACHTCYWPYIKPERTYSSHFWCVYLILFSVMLHGFDKVTLSSSNSFVFCRINIASGSELSSLSAREFFFIRGSNICDCYFNPCPVGIGEGSRPRPWRRVRRCLHQVLGDVVQALLHPATTTFYNCPYFVLGTLSVLLWTKCRQSSWYEWQSLVIYVVHSCVEGGGQGPILPRLWSLDVYGFDFG
jgi:hypothetical protein